MHCWSVEQPAGQCLLFVNDSKYTNALLFLAYLVLESRVNMENVHKAEMMQMTNKAIYRQHSMPACGRAKSNSSAKQDLLYI